MRLKSIIQMVKEFFFLTALSILLLSSRANAGCWFDVTYCGFTAPAEASDFINNDLYPANRIVPRSHIVRTDDGYMIEFSLYGTLQIGDACIGTWGAGLPRGIDLCQNFPSASLEAQTTQDGITHYQVQRRTAR